MMGIPGKLLLAVRSLLVYLVRLSCVVAFFGPFLGLFNVLAHWKAEQMLLDFKVSNRSNIYGNPERTGSHILKAFFKADYSDPENPLPPSYAIYTQATLGTSFAFFLVLITIQGLVNLFLKTKLSQQFKEARWTTKMQHLLESVNRGDSFTDWDMVQGTPSDQQKM